jgi:hypothetical protein
MGRVRLALLSVVAAIVLTGCSNNRTPAPPTGLIPAPNVFRDLTYPAAGVTVKAPANWREVRGSAPQLATIAIGDAQIALWRYPRTEPLPQTRSQLDAARQALVAQVQRRDATFELTSSRLVVKRGLRAVEIVGQATNQGQRRAVRSLHAYGHGAEVVLDAFAPPSDFARVDEETFARVARSLRLRAPKS